VVVRGQVQMVGFRAFAERRALAYGLDGYVRNLMTGEVEVVVEGDRTLLEEFLADLRQGPRAARVTDVLASWETPRGEFHDFRVRY
jgi:acylphosphatase